MFWLLQSSAYTASFCSSPARRLGVHKNMAGRGHSSASCLQLTQGISHFMRSHAQQLGREEVGTWEHLLGSLLAISQGGGQLFSVATLVSGFIFLSLLCFSSLPYNFLKLLLLFNDETFFLHPRICFLLLPFQFFPHPTGWGY